MSTAPDGTEVACRPAAAGDLRDVADVLLAARAAAVPAMPPVPPGAEGAVRRDVARWAEDRDGETWVAEADGRTIGFARVVGDWLEALYVDPAGQRRGVGTMLLDVVAARRPDGFCLWVFESNLPARRFYARAGLLELERTDGSDNPEREPDVRMVWPGRDPLAFLRRLIDEVDDGLGDLLARRAALTAAVQTLRAEPVRDPGREAEVARRVAARAPALGERRTATIMAAVIAESLDAARD